LNKLPPKRRQKVEIKTNQEIIEKIKEARVKEKGRNGTLEAYTLTSTAKKDGVCEYVSEILMETEEKIIVFAYHHEMMNSVEKLLQEKKVEYIRIDGSTKQDKRYDYVKCFQQKKECRVAIVSIIAGSTGITLNKAHIVIFAELTWTPSIMIQAEDRAHRIGQKSNFVDIKYLYGPGTLDDFILDKLQKKLVIVSTTIDDKRENFGVKADPNLIYAEKKPKNSQELVKLSKGDFDMFKSSESESEEEIDSKKMEKKMIEALMENDPELEFIGFSDKKENKEDKNKNSNSIEDISNISDEFNLNLNVLQNIGANNNQESDSDNDNNEDSLEAYFDDLDKYIYNNNINNMDEPNNGIDLNKDKENKEQDKGELITLNDKLFGLAGDNIKEPINHKNFINTEIKIYKNELVDKDNDSNKKQIFKYPKIKEKKPFYNNKKIKYPKDLDDIDLDDDENLLLINKKSNKIKHKKTRYPKMENERRKTPDSSNLKKHKKLPEVKKNKKRYNSIGKNDETSNYNEKPIKDIDDNSKNKDLVNNIENNLMINLHKVNMRRSISQMETKQSQSSLFNEENNNDKKYNTQRFLFIHDKDKDKDLFNEKNDEIINEKVKLTN